MFQLKILTLTHIVQKSLNPFDYSMKECEHINMGVGKNAKSETDIKTACSITSFWPSLYTNVF